MIERVPRVRAYKRWALDVPRIIHMVFLLLSSLLASRCPVPFSSSMRVGVRVFTIPRRHTCASSSAKDRVTHESAQVHSDRRRGERERATSDSHTRAKRPLLPLSTTNNDTCLSLFLDQRRCPIGGARFAHFRGHKQRCRRRWQRPVTSSEREGWRRLSSRVAKTETTPGAAVSRARFGM